MNLSSFDYFILGILVSIPVTVIGGLYTTRLQQRLAERSQKRATARIDVIKREYEEAKRYHDNPLLLVLYAVKWVFWLTIYWILISTLGSLFDFGSNGSYFINENGIASLLNSINSVISVIFLTFLFRNGYRAYRIFRRIEHFEEYESLSLEEISELEQVRGKSQTPPPVAPTAPTTEVTSGVTTIADHNEARQLADQGGQGNG